MAKATRLKYTIELDREELEIVVMALIADSQGRPAYKALSDLADTMRDIYHQRFTFGPTGNNLYQPDKAAE